MYDGTTESLRLTFPADATFGRLGRVAVAGLALRLGVDVERVERLRLAVDGAVRHLVGQGEILIESTWHPGRLDITCTNSSITLTDDQYAAIEGELIDLVSGVDRCPHGLSLNLLD